MFIQNKITNTNALEVYAKYFPMQKEKLSKSVRCLLLVEVTTDRPVCLSFLDKYR